MNEIKCQRCKPDDDGCGTCGGYKIIYSLWTCKCGRTGWVRPGAYTSYEGKRWFTRDGLEVVDHFSGGRNCIYCEEAK